MTKKVKRALSNFFLFMASAGSRGHIVIQAALGRLERANIRQWKRGMLFFLNLYEKLRNNHKNHQGRNGRGEQ